MIRITDILPAGRWDPSQATDQVRADYDGRHRRRMLMRTSTGRELLLDLPETRHLRDGDGLRLPDGEIVRISAAPESLLAIRAHDPLHLLRLVWHLGNRHLPAELHGDHVLIRDDHVIADMIRGLGGHVTPVTSAFDPETGAYAGNGDHPHDHGYGHDDA